MDLKLLRSLVSRIEEGKPLALVTVFETRGSAPRHAGASMVVGPDRQILGTVGGGRVESQAIDAALETLASGQSKILDIEMLGQETLGSDMICGGLSRMLIELVLKGSPYEAVLKPSELRKPLVLVRTLGAQDRASQVDPDPRVLEGDSISADLLAVEALKSQEFQLAPDSSRICDPIVYQDRLFVFGGGHVGQALARLAVETGYEVSIVDDRREFADPSRFPGGVQTLSGSFSAIIADMDIDSASFAVVTTRGHLTDLECVHALLQKRPRYLGFIGSSRKTRLILEQLVIEGFEMERLNALWAPIGLDIGAETPAEIAISILAEIIAVKHGALLPAAPGRARRILKT